MAATLSCDPARRHVPAEPAEGLPRAFLHSLRTLFDILDDGRRGSVHIQEIESRWRGADTLELPRGVLECLRRAAPPSGLLTFERFVQGLRSSLSKTGGGTGPGQARVTVGKEKHWGVLQQLPTEPAPLGVHPMNGGSEMIEHPPSVQEAGSSDRPAIPRNPGGFKGVDANTMVRSQSEGTCTGLVNLQQHPRSRADHRRHTITSGVDYGMLKRMKELEQEKDFLIQGLDALEWARDWYHQQIHLVQERQKHLGKSKTPNESLEENQSYLNHLFPRLQEVNRILNDLVSSSGKPLSSSSSALNGFTAAIATSTCATVGQQQSINMLKEQNRLLTKEVTDKSDRITQLEQEKSALIKQLFEARARNTHDSSQLDSTFI